MLFLTITELYTGLRQKDLPEAALTSAGESDLDNRSIELPITESAQSIEMIAILLHMLIPIRTTAISFLSTSLKL